MDILEQLKQNKPFSGRNGTRWHESCELQHVIWAFECGDYYFL